MYTCYFDGGFKNHIMYYGFCCYNDRGELVHKDSGYIKEDLATTNIAEYRALIKLLEWLVQNGIKRAKIRGDSQIIIYQVTGRYKTKSEHLKRLHDMSQFLMGQFGEVEISWIPREENQFCDGLCKDHWDSKKE